MSDVVAFIASPPVVARVSGGEGPKGDPGSPGEGHPTRAAIAALTPAAFDDTFLTEAGREGKFVFDASDLSAEVTADPQQGVYLPPASDPTGASGAWVRRFTVLDARWFGIVAGDSSIATKTANATALENLLAFLQSTATAVAGGSGRFKGAYKVFWPKSIYHFASPNPYFSVKAAVIFEGEQCADSGAAAPSTQLIFDEGGFLVERYNTLRGAEEVPESSGGDGSIFRSLFLSSIQARPAAVDYETDSRSGILALARAVVDNCWIEEFTRDGVELIGNSTAIPGVATNVNCSIVRDGTMIRNGRHGLYINGPDANACVIENLKTDYNNNWGIYDSCFLQNHHSGHHAAENGTGNAAPSKGDGLTSIVSHLGTLYFVNVGQAVAASTTEPGTDDDVWVPSTAAGPNSGHPAWVNGTTYKEGGSYFHGGITPTVWVNTYTEAGQAQPYMSNDGVLLGGSWQFNPHNTAPLRPSGGLELNVGTLALIGDTNLRVDSQQSTHNFGFDGGGGTPSQITFNWNFSGAAGFKFEFNDFNTGGGATVAFIHAKPTILELSGTNAVDMKLGGSLIGRFNSGGLDLQSGKTLEIAGTQVVGAQQTAIADAAGGATVDAEARAAINALLAAARAHGLIDT